MGDIMDSIIEHLCDKSEGTERGDIVHQSRITLPSGRAVWLTVSYDEVTNPFTDWDCYGTIVGADGEIAWRRRNPSWGTPNERPEGFDGRARIIHGDSRGAFGDDVWWQPPADADADQIEACWQKVRDYQHLCWNVYVVAVEVDGCAESLGGVEIGFDLAEDAGHVIRELLVEVGVDEDIERMCVEHPALTTMAVC